MCGIFGQITPGRPIDPVCCYGAIQSMKHRGPDGLGVALGRLSASSPAFLRDPDVGRIQGHSQRAAADFFLGHRRLAIIDLAEAAYQPMTNEDGTVWVVFNGEIYNHESLRQTLSAAGHRFQTDHSDTEVLVHGYEQWGETLLERLRGMFGLAILDLRQRTLFLARDRFGEKPLYYRADSQGISFASELKALCRLPEVDCTPSRQALVDYVSHGFIPAPRTVFDGVGKLPAAHCMIVKLDRPGESVPRRYWSLRYEADPEQSETEWQEQFQEELGRSVRLRLMSDVPLGVFLSGGLDSTMVATCVSRSVSEPVRSFSIGFSEPRYDESPWAEQAARHLKLRHRQRIITPTDLLAEIDTVAGIFDEPFADSSAVPTYLVAKLAREEVTVALSGDGGDEMLAGYRRYAMMHRIGQWIDRLPRGVTRAVVGPWRSIWPEHVRGRAFLDLLVPGIESRYRRVFSDDTLRGKMRPEAVPEWDCLLQSSWSAEGGEPVDRWCSMDRQLYIPEDLMVKADRTSMYASLEVRAPLLDHKLFELVARAPVSTRFDGRVGKLPFRDALRGEFGREFVDRPKQGFSVPLGRWFRQELREPLRAALLRPNGIVDSLFPPQAVRQLVDGHQNGTRDQSTRLWRLYMLALWHQRVLENSPARVTANAAA
ncbi:MAG: asparagine synthase (glutamine-hydrolyzing) [Planctomycetaceae bacterium]|nr:asparagine synthase (glutamine-hydrolyzing) [Planctomycetaceae bacterium]